MATQKDAFLSKVKTAGANIDLSLVRKAYEFSQNAHSGQKRKNGADFFSHVENVALLALKYSPDTESVCAALLHDVVEDTNIPLETIEREFGKGVSFLVDGLTKIEAKKSRKTNKQLTVKKVIRFGQKDPRVFTLKFVDKLDNLNTIYVHPKEKQVEIVNELKTLYIPSAQKLGLKMIEEEFTRQYSKYKKKLGM
ncbi:MAG: HD domain-containing protein [Nanoarchaeota archaeon]